MAPSAQGSPEQCAAAVARQFDLGADGVICHGASPTDLAPIIEAYRAAGYDPGRDRWGANPGVTLASSRKGR